MKLKNLFPLIFVLLFFFGGCNYFDLFPKQKEPPEDEKIETEIFVLRGAWVSTVWNIDFPSKPTQNNSELSREIDEIVLQAKTSGLNAIFFQVRPCADAFYNSEIFPWSRFLSGAQGVTPKNGFDPLLYIIEKCHENEIQLHAWINPYRISVLQSDELVSTHPAKLQPELTLNIDNKLYFNPGEPKSKELILAGVREILENYNVDGIHFDDYFYPETITNEDYSAWQKYGGNYNIADWRRNNVDQLINQTHMLIKELSPNAVFGVSPSGVWANKSQSNPLGSDTRGFESYNAIYADSRGWVKKGYVDYIAPQIYWYIGQSGADFVTLLHWWHNVCDDTNVALYIGLAGYKINSGGAWNNSTEFENQILLSSEIANGFIVFSFSNVHSVVF